MTPNPILKFLTKNGFQLLNEHREYLLKAFEGWSDDALNRFVTDFANSLPSGGLKSVEFNSIKGAFISAQPKFDQDLNIKIEQAFDALVSILKQYQ